MKGRGLVKGADELASTAQAAQLIGGLSQDLLEICKSLVVKISRHSYRLISVFLGSKRKGCKEITFNGICGISTKISKFSFYINLSIHYVS